MTAPRGTEAAPPPRRPVSRYLIGCLLVIPGFFGGGMVAVEIGKVVSVLRRCVPPEGGPPACGGWNYLLVGGIIGGLILPVVVVWRMRKAAAADRQSTRG